MSHQAPSIVAEETGDNSNAAVNDEEQQAMTAPNRADRASELVHWIRHRAPGSWYSFDFVREELERLLESCERLMANDHHLVDLNLYQAIDTLAHDILNVDILAILLGKALMGNENLKSLTIAMHGKTAVGANALGDGIAKSKLSYLCLDNTGFGKDSSPSHLQIIIAKQAIRFSTIQDLRINFSVGDDTIQELADCLEHSHVLKSLAIGFWFSIGRKGLVALEAGISKSKLEQMELSIMRPPREPDAIREFVARTKLTKLTLISSWVDKGDVLHGGLEMNNGSKLETLELLMMNLPTCAIDTINNQPRQWSGLIRDTTKFKCIRVRKHQGPGGRDVTMRQHLPHAAVIPTWLTSLTLAHCNIDNGGLQWLASCMSGHEITKLDLTHNLIGDESVEIFTGIIAGQAMSLKELILRDNKIGGDSAIAIVMAHTQWRILDFGGNVDIGFDGLRRLAELFPNAPVETLLLEGVVADFDETNDDQ